jgi:hypothetical protein
LRFMLRDSYASYTDELIAERTLSNGMRFQIEQEEKKRISNQIGGETWEFDCPICNSPKTIVAGLDLSEFEKSQVSLPWGVCVSCHLVMPKQAYHLADLVLSKELEMQRDAILDGYR